LEYLGLRDEVEVAKLYIEKAEKIISSYNKEVSSDGFQTLRK
jgi:hypothetical protein